MTYLVTFVSGILNDIIHHRNQLKHYRSSIHELEDVLKTVVIDIDFSENLSVPVKFEPQSKHWDHEQVTVHSGILKKGDNRYYHPYLSNDKKHDQSFVKCVIDEMIKDIIEPGMTLIIESDNCTSQYKAVENFHNLQELSNKYNITIIYLYGIAGHGKGEVDHVGGIAKVSIRREIAEGGFMSDAGEMLAFLQDKFVWKTDPTYVIKEIDENRLEVARAESRLKKFKTIDGLTKFQAMCFKPNSVNFKAGPYICSCESCINDYGSCNAFKSYDLDVQILNETVLCSNNELQNINLDDDDDAADFFAVDSFVAVAAAESSPDTVWFIKVTKEIESSEQNLEDSFGNVVLVGQMHLRGYFLEREYCTAKGHLFKLNTKRETFLFKESIVYPFVNFVEQKKGLFLSNADYVDILNYTQHRGIYDVTAI